MEKQTIELTPQERKLLKKAAHGLKPVVFVGQKGLTDALFASTESAFAAHELIKIRFVDVKDKAQKSVLAAEIAETTGGAFVGMVGHVATFFKPSPNLKNRRFQWDRETKEME